MKAIENLMLRYGWVRVSTMMSAVDAVTREADRERARRAAAEDQLVIQRTAPVTPVTLEERCVLENERLCAVRERSYAMA